MKDKCKVEGCDLKNNIRKGLCNKHYIRLRIHGDVYKVKQIQDGRTNHFLYTTYADMINRCTKIKHKEYSNYGGRGIDVDPTWLCLKEGVWLFYKAMESLGLKPTISHSLDRIDNDKGYWIWNLKWSTKREQVCNRRNNNKNIGVIKNRNSWKASLEIEGVKHYKYFKDYNDALFYRKYLEKTYLTS
jgi:hypothetical protein